MALKGGVGLEEAVLERWLDGGCGDTVGGDIVIRRVRMSLVKIFPGTRMSVMSLWFMMTHA